VVLKEKKLENGYLLEQQSPTVSLIMANSVFNKDHGQERPLDFQAIFKSAQK